MPHRNRVIVVDDKCEDGEAIVRCLWKLQIPSYFFWHDGQAIAALDESKGFEGIRFIFQDIDLTQKGGVPGAEDYSAAAAAINKLLKIDNGPWLLIAWSTWGNEPEYGDKFAQDLFDYLIARLPKGKQPYRFVVIDKTPYLENGLHGQVKAELTDDESSSLITSVSSAVNSVKNLEALGHWEADVRSSASRVVHDLWNMINRSNAEELDKRLGGLLFELAKAQEGSRITHTDDLSSPLYQILSTLLYDTINHLKAQEIRITDDVIKDVNHDLINTMLHWEPVAADVRYAPGNVYEWPSNGEIDFGNLNISDDKRIEFIKDTFIPNNNWQNENLSAGLTDYTKLVLLDITPACDHANDKAFWRKFLVGVEVDERIKDYFYTKRKGEVSLSGHNLKDTPTFKKGENGIRFIFNSKLLVSLRDKGEYFSQNAAPVQDKSNKFVPDVAKLKLVGRIREQMLHDIMAWFGAMATRPGIVSLR